MSTLVQQIADEFDIPISTLLSRHRIAYPEAHELVVAEIGEQGRKHRVTPACMDAWQRMKQAASGDGVSIFIVSAFRSVERQAQIVRRKLSSGIPVDQVLAVSALPGYSEHHTGRAVDIGTPDSAPLEHAFHDTSAFAWLQSHAAAFSFRLSYPADNAEGYIYEPWHWCYQPAAVKG
jgi:D-alanyl-D-alanine carboxypeptidase